MGSPSGAEVKNSPTIRETQVLSLDQEDPLEKGMATHFSTPIPKKGNAKECSNNHTIAHISHASHVMLRILQARLQQYVNRELQMIKWDLEKMEETEIKLPTSVGSQKKYEDPRKKHLLLLHWLC